MSFLQVPTLPISQKRILGIFKQWIKNRFYLNNSFCLILTFWFTLSNTQGLLLALQSGLRTQSWWCSGEPYGMVGIKPESAVCKANAFPAVLSLWPLFGDFEKGEGGDKRDSSMLKREQGLSKGRESTHTHFKRRYMGNTCVWTVIPCTQESLWQLPLLHPHCTVRKQVSVGADLRTKVQQTREVLISLPWGPGSFPVCLQWAGAQSNDLSVDLIHHCNPTALALKLWEVADSTLWALLQEFPHRYMAHRMQRRY